MTHPLTDREIRNIKYHARMERRGLTSQPRKKPGPVPKYSKAEARRRQIKLNLRIRHSGPKLDIYIARLEERLEILKEIRNERTTPDRGGNDDRTAAKPG